MSLHKIKKVFFFFFLLDFMWISSIKFFFFLTLFPLYGAPSRLPKSSNAVKEDDVDIHKIKTGPGGSGLNKITEFLSPTYANFLLMTGLKGLYICASATKREPKNLIRTRPGYPALPLSLEGLLQEGEGVFLK